MLIVSCLDYLRYITRISVIQRVKQLSEETRGIKGKDIADLSLQQTAELAGKNSPPMFNEFGNAL